MNIWRRDRLAQWLYLAAIAAGILTVLAIISWGRLMAATGSALDAYPSRWIHSTQFISVVCLGSLAGALFWGAVVPWKPMKIAVTGMLALGVPILFRATYYSWFEMFNWVERSPMDTFLINLGNIGAFVVGLGFILTCISAPFCLLYQFGYHIIGSILTKKG